MEEFDIVNLLEPDQEISEMIVSKIYCKPVLPGGIIRDLLFFIFISRKMWHFQCQGAKFFIPKGFEI